MEDRNARIPVILLTGFLGSGKTTLLNQLVRQSFFSKTLVIINEFGEISLDHLLVTQSTETVVMEMGNGCVCCSIRGDLAKVLKDATWRFARNGTRSFDRVVIETTGLADPAPVLHTLMTSQHIASRYRLDAIVTAVDSVNAMETLDRHTEAVKQIAVADRIILTKSDLVDEQTLSAVQQRVHALNPSAMQLPAVNGLADLQPVFNNTVFSIDQKTPDVMKWLNAESYESKPANRYQPVSPGDNPSLRTHPPVTAQSGVNRHDDHVQAFCFTFEDPIEPALFDDWLNLLMAIKGPDILRIKGILNMKNHATPWVIHGVQHIFHPPVELPGWPSEDRRTRIVFITRDVPYSVIKDTFIALVGSARASHAS
ncbi:GTP-binding protein [Nitrosomonas sp. sh817]|jgi:G3E family GTPase|uniref:CobW family GTP-binding protein n=1 Tax=unclassified Nitrosomonas TaxID=2609265 RepID=UPI0027DD0C76|nr:GTP-binding protein [Nitrosomonas sp. sh817]WMJ09869.1 GTP-binding protein [Nitrosomonas sp. sh817]